MKFSSLASLLIVLTVCLLSQGCNKPAPETAQPAQPTPPPEPPDVALKKMGYEVSSASLVVAAGNGEVNAVRLLLDSGIDPNSQDADGATALIRAAEAGQLAVIQLLLERGAEPDRPGRELWTPLMSAAYYNKPDVVSALLAKGADPALKDASGWSALMKAVQLGNVESIKLIAPHSKEELDRALMLAAVNGKPKVVEAMLDAGANPNAELKKQTPLMFAAMKGEAEAAKVLLQRGADPLAINETGSTASIIALEKGFTDLSKIIDTFVAERPAVDPTATPAPAATPIATPEVAATAAPTRDPTLAATPQTEQTPAAEQPTPEAAASGTPVPNPDQLAATSGTPSAPADVAMIDPDAPAIESTAPATTDADYSAWAARYQIDPKDPASANADGDADGFSNREEFEARTEPNDPESHPSRTSRLKMISFKGEEVPLVLQSLSGGKATLRRSDTGAAVEVSRGDKVQGFPYRVTGIREKATTDKNGQNINISEVTLVNMSTGSTVVLLPDLPARSPESYAVLHMEGIGEKINVRQDQVFTLPGDRTTKYKVMDLRPNEVVLQEVASNQTVTIPLEKQ